MPEEVVLSACGLGPWVGVWWTAHLLVTCLLPVVGTPAAKNRLIIDVGCFPAATYCCLAPATAMTRSRSLALQPWLSSPTSSASRRAGKRCGRVLAWCSSSSGCIKRVAAPGCAPHAFFVCACQVYVLHVCSPAEYLLGLRMLSRGPNIGRRAEASAAAGVLA